MKQPGRFITFEGMDGAGKSTNLEYARGYLQNKGITLVVTREPGGTTIAEKIREMLLAPESRALDPRAEVLLMFAARTQNLRDVVLPALRRGDVVLCDRFTDATYAYQGAGRAVERRWIEQLEDMVQSGLQPNLTLFFDLPPEIGLARLGARPLDRFEQESLAFHQRVRAEYLERAARFAERIRVIDAQQPLAAVQAEVRRLLDEKPT